MDDEKVDSEKDSVLFLMFLFLLWIILLLLLMVLLLLVMVLLLFKHRTVEVNLVAILFGALTVVALFSGAYNLIFADDFFVGNFSVHLVRLVGMTIALMILPPLIRSEHIEHARFIVKSLVGIILIHIIAVIAHNFGVLPFPANNYSYMVAGLFKEPAWFGIWVFLALATISQYEWNTARNLTTIWVSDCGICGGVCSPFGDSVDTDSYVTISSVSGIVGAGWCTLTQVTE